MNSSSETHIVSLSRMRKILQSLAEIDLNNDPELHERLIDLQERSRIILAGVKLKRGNPTGAGLRLARQRSAEIRHERTRQRDVELIAVIRTIEGELKEAGRDITYKEIAQELDRRGIKPPRDGRWKARTVSAILNRQPTDEKPLS